MKRLLLVLAFFVSGIITGFAAEFESGEAAADITPPVPYRLRGYFSERPSTGIHDPLHAKAMVFRQGKCQAAIVLLDLTAVPRHITDAIRNGASKATGIPREAIIVAATHSHTAPLFCNALRDYLHDKAIEKHGKDIYEEFDYPKYLVDSGIRSVVEAHKSLRPSRFAFGAVEAPPVAFNRRYFLKNETDVRCNPGVKNPNIIKPAGPIDPTLAFFFVYDSSSQTPRAAFANFALHLDTTGGTMVSADYPYYLSEVLKGKYGDKFLTVFGTGTCGDLNHIDVSGRTRNKAPQIGQMLGDAIVAATEKGLSMKTASLATAQKVAVCRQVFFSESETQDALARRAEMFSNSKVKLPLLERMRIEKAASIAGTPRDMEFDIQAIRLSDDTAIVAIPGEIFVESGLAIKQNSPFTNTIVVELSQDDVGYIPTKKACTQGSYEVYCNRFEPGAAEILVQTALDTLNMLK